jgi:hypothetical protein
MEETLRPFTTTVAILVRSTDFTEEVVTALRGYGFVAEALRSARPDDSHCRGDTAT